MKCYMIVPINLKLETGVIDFTSMSLYPIYYSLDSLLSSGKFNEKLNKIYFTEFTDAIEIIEAIRCSYYGEIKRKFNIKILNCIKFDKE